MLNPRMKSGRIAALAAFVLLSSTALGGLVHAKELTVGLTSDAVNLPCPFMAWARPRVLPPPPAQ